jgi:hypothetical protein
METMERWTFPCTHCGQPQVFVRNTYQINRAWVAVELVVLGITAICIGVWGLLVIPIFLMVGYGLFRSKTWEWWVCTGCGNGIRNSTKHNTVDGRKSLHPLGG